MRRTFAEMLETSLGKIDDRSADPVRKLVITLHASPLSKTERIRFPALRSGAPYFKITITDNGIGFPQEYAYQIFEMFHRLHTAADYRGTGIGLATPKKIAENHKDIFMLTPRLDTVQLLR